MGWTKFQLEQKFGVKCFTQWRWVPSNFHTRKFYKELNIEIPEDTKPDAIKGGGLGMGNHYSLLFDEAKYLPGKRLSKADK